MSAFVEITSPQNPRVKDLARLREGRHRRRTGCYIIEGLRETGRAFDGGADMRSLFVCEEFWSDDACALLSARISASEDIECFRLSGAAFRKGTNRENPDGILAVAAMQRNGLQSLRLGPNPLLLVVEHVEKPGNLGTLLRSADAAGVDAVIVTDPVTDLYSPQSIRASQGSIFAVPTVFADNAEARAYLLERGIVSVATTPDAPETLWKVDMSRPVALLLGSEADGLSSFWIDDPDTIKAKIPMSGRSADSLNVSAAAAVFLFEAARQRSL